MHSELSDVITNASTNPVAPESATVPSQHGLDSSDRLLPLRSGSATGADIGAPDAVDDALFGAYALGELAADDDARLKKPSPPPRNRIAEYENALSPSPQRKPEGPIFEVIKKNRKAHYVMMNVTADNAALAEVKRIMSINENVLRFLFVSVDAHETTPSELLKSSRYGRDEGYQGEREQRGREHHSNQDTTDNHSRAGRTFQNAATHEKQGEA